MADKNRLRRFSDKVGGNNLRLLFLWSPQENRRTVSRIAPSSCDGTPDLSDAYVGTIIGDAARSMAESFLASGGRAISHFRTAIPDRELVVGVKVVPYRCTPILVAQALTPDTSPVDMAEQHPELGRVLALSGYGWETPAYRSLCFDLGLDPDEGRPNLLPRFCELGNLLIEWVGLSLSTHDFDHASTVCDAVDLMRVDVLPSHGDLDSLRSEIASVPVGDLPVDARLRSLVAGDALLSTQDRTSTTVDPSGGGFALVQFLPSRYGLGFKAKLHESGDARWSYPALRGLAVLPTLEEMSASSWLTYCVFTLRRQGVLFLEGALSVADYLDTEGSFWLRVSPQPVRIADHDILPPGWRKRTLWRLRKPPMPVDAEISRREAFADQGAAELVGDAHL